MLRFSVCGVVLAGGLFAGLSLGGEKVTLGDPSLTAGIPGKGKLTSDQVKSWLADPKNHLDLSVELPMGLAAGSSLIQGIKENPLTRAKIELGRQLYFDPKLSADASVSCAECHHPDEGYSRHTTFGVGIKGQEGNRNSPVSYNRLLTSVQFWDGRANSLEEQAKGPIANPIEMGNTHEKVVADLKKNDLYRAQFEKVFKDGVTIDNVARAIASFERVIVTGASPFDYFDRVKSIEKGVGADLETLKEDDPELFARYEEAKKASAQHAISDSAKRGYDIYFTDKGRCSTCHVGANLSDEKYHNLGVGMDKPKPDLGRYDQTKVDADKGAFKTPTIRNVALSAPYMHDGSQATLEEVVEWYDKGGEKNPYLSDKIVPLKLTKEEKADLVEFMKACTGDFPKVEIGRFPE
ncbi:c-type cytochrome [bacterium]|nr:c-type cytochrome [bacterium]